MGYHDLALQSGMLHREMEDEIRWLRWFLSRPGIWVGTIIVGLALFLLSVPLMTGGGCRDARSAEGEQLMGSARDFCRIEYSKTGDFSEVVKQLQLEVDKGSFRGKYYGVEARMVAVDSNTARVYAFPENPQDRFGVMEFHWSSGNSTIEWHDFGERK